MPRLLLAALLAIALAAAATPAAAQSGSCAGEAARLQRAEAELPKLDVAPPDDKQIVCITLETNILFARRLLAHLKQGPRSSYARSGGEWRRLESTYAARFSRRGCKQSIRGYRG
jgi:hypothetical protein